MPASVLCRPPRSISRRHFRVRGGNCVWWVCCFGCRSSSRSRCSLGGKRSRTSDLEPGRSMLVQCDLCVSLSHTACLYVRHLFTYATCLALTASVFVPVFVSVFASVPVSLLLPLSLSLPLSPSRCLSAVSPVCLCYLSPACLLFTVSLLRLCCLLSLCCLYAVSPDCLYCRCL